MAQLQPLGYKAVIEGFDAYVQQLKAMQKAGDDTARGLDDSAKKAKAANDAFGTLQKGSALLSAGILGIGLASVKMAADFQHQMSQVGAIAGATDEEMGKLSAAALKIGADTAFSASQAASAMEELAAGGRSVSQIIGGEALAAVNLAAAGNYGLADSARVIATSMSVWEGTQISTNEVVNRLAGAANASRFGVDDMAQAVAAGGGVAKAAGVDFGDFSTAIAATANSFSSGSDAGTSFKTFITSLTGNSNQAKDALAALGIITKDGSNAFYDAAGNLKNMSEITQILHDALGGLSQEQQTVAMKTIFGNDAYRTAAGLMKLTGDEFTAMSAKMKSTDAAAVAKQRMDNLSGGIEQLKGSIETVGIAIGTRAIPMLTGLAAGATKATNAFGELPVSTQNLVLAIGTMVVALPAMIGLVQKGAVAVQTLGLAMQTARGRAALMAVGIGAIIIGLDLLSQKATGASLTDRVFGDVGKTEAGKKAVDEFAAALLAGGEKADKSKIALDQLAKTTAEFASTSADAAGEQSGLQNALLGNDNRIFGFNVGLSGGIDNLKKLKAETEVSAKALVENGATVYQLKSAYDALPPTLQKTFDDVTHVSAAWSIAQDAVEKEIFAVRSADSVHAAAAKSMEYTGAAIAKLGQTGEELATYMGATWGPTLNSVFATFEGDTKNKLASIQGKFPDVQISADGLRAYLKETFGPDGASAFDDFEKKVESSFKDMKGALAEIFPAVDESFTNWKKRIDQMVVDQQNFEKNLKIIYAGITAAGVAFPDEILGALADKGPAFVAMFTKLYLEDPTKALKVLKVAAPAAMGVAADQITNRVIGGIPGMTAATTALINKPFTAAAAASRAEMLASGGPSIVRGLADGIAANSGLIDTAAQKTGSMVPPGVAKGIRDNDAQARYAAEWLVSATTEAARLKAVETSPSIGAAISQGVGSGISARISNPVAAAVTMIGEVLRAAKAKAEAQSPSELFAREVGKPIPQGIAKGIDDGSMTVTSALDKLFGPASTWWIGLNKTKEQLLAWWADTGAKIGVAAGAAIGAGSAAGGAGSGGLPPLNTSGNVGGAGGFGGAAGGSSFAAPRPDKSGNIPGVQGYDVTQKPDGSYEYTAHNYGGTAPGLPIKQPDGTYVSDSQSNHPGQYWNGTGWYSTNVNNPKSNADYGQASSQPGGFHIDIATGFLVPNKSAAIGLNYSTKDQAVWVHRGEAVIPEAYNAWGPGSSVSAPMGGGGAGGSTKSITIDMRGAQLTGTLAENEALMTRVARQVLNDDLGRGSVLAGVTFR